MKTSHSILRLCALVLAAVGTVAAMTDKATGISFPSQLMGMPICGVGCRKKGPIKVYSVGMYASGLQGRLSALSASGKSALAALRKGAGVDDSTTFLLEMNFKVGAEKMASAIAEGVAPRHKGDASEVDQLKDLIFNGVAKKGAATKGTTFQFDCTSSGVDVAVDGKKQGGVSSSGLSSAFCDIYLDDKTVSPPLRKSCIEKFCLP